jgi:hypothetical protein
MIRDDKMSHAGNRLSIVYLIYIHQDNQKVASEEKKTSSQ